MSKALSRMLKPNEPVVSGPAPRYRVTLLVRYAVSPQGGRDARGGVARTHNLSLTGACLDLPEPLDPGTSLQLLVDDATGSLDLRASVVWTHKTPEGGILHGVAFTALRPDHAAALDALLRRAELTPTRSVLQPPLPARVQGTLEVTILDIGPDGARLEHVTALRPGFPCILTVSAASGPLHLPARVVRSRIVGEERGADEEWRLKYETGIAFTLIPAQAESLARFLAQAIPPGTDGRPGRIVLTDATTEAYSVEGCSDSTFTSEDRPDGARLRRNELASSVIDSDEATRVLDQGIGQLRELEEEEHSLR